MNSIKNGGMVVLSVPTRLRIATLAILLSIPLISLEVIIVAQAPFWKLPYKNIGYWATTFLLISVPLIVWMNSGKRWALKLCAIFGLLWIIASFWMTFHSGYPQLGFLTFLLCLYFAALLLALQYEMDRSFFNPELPWYQGLPKPIPGLKCQLFDLRKNKEGLSSSISVELAVCRLDQNGTYLFCQKLDSQGVSFLSSLLNKRKLGMAFNFRGRKVEIQGTPITRLAQGSGCGIQFIETTDDLSKDIGDFVELLKGEGYV
jgi:hypothetical protein